MRRVTASDELPSIVWIEPSGRTASTTPMCSSQTIRSPGCGVPLPGRDRLARALGPGVDVVDAAEALARVAERDARLAGRPRREVRAPRPDAAAGRRLAVLRDARRVVGAGRLLGLADLLADEVDDRLPGGRAAGGARERLGRGERGRRHAGAEAGLRVLEGAHERRGRRRRGGRRRDGLGLQQRVELGDPGDRDFEGHRPQWSEATRGAFNVNRRAQGPPVQRSVPRWGYVGPSAGAKERPAGPGWPARACSCRPAAGSGAS